MAIISTHLKMICTNIHVYTVVVPLSHTYEKLI